MFHIENTRWPFYWAVSWRLPVTARATQPVGASEPGCPSHASEASRHSSSKEPLLSLHTVCGLEVNVDTTSGIFLSVPVQFSPPEPYAGLGRESVTSVLEPVRTCLWREVGTGFGRGSRPRQRSCLYVFDHAHPSERSKAAWSKLHYQEYLGERISVNPNRYKDFCFRFVMDLLENFASSVLVFCFRFFFLKPHCLSLFFLCFWPSFLSHPNYSVTIWSNRGSQFLV